MEIKHFISHRGNISGSNKESENKISSVLNVIEKGFECEIDLWFEKGKFYLGHDEPNEIVEEEFLTDLSEKLWIHCKNLAALNKLSTYKTLNYFWHEKDKYTLTSKNYIWTYPDQETLENSIIVNLNSKIPKGNYVGICSDFISDIKLEYFSKG